MAITLKEYRQSIGRRKKKISLKKFVEMGDFATIFAELEKTLPPTLQKQLTILKHALGTLAFGVIKRFMDHMDVGCEFCHHTVDEDFKFWDIYIQDHEGKKQSWRVGTEQMFKAYLTNEYEVDDERLGFFSTTFIIDFLRVQSDKIRRLLDSDYIVNDPSTRGALIRALLVDDVSIKSIVEKMVEDDGIERCMHGYGSTQNEFEFEGETYIYFRVD